LMCAFERNDCRRTCLGLSLVAHFCVATVKACAAAVTVRFKRDPQKFNRLLKETIGSHTVDVQWKNELRVK
jgi:hypothetical protein